MFCRYCGAEMPNDSVHCPKCGKEVTDMAPVPEERSRELAERPCDGGNPPPPPPPPKKKGLVAPIILLLIAASGWLYILYTNSIEGMVAWFTSYGDINSSLSSKYVYNNSSADEILGNVLLLTIMVLFTLLGVIGLIMLIVRLIRRFAPRRHECHDPHCPENEHHGREH